MSRNSEKYLIIIALSLTLLTALGWMCSTWYYCDDFVYKHFIGRGQEAYYDFWEARAPLLTSWSQLPELLVNHWVMVNGRWPNQLIWPIMLTDRQVGCVLSAVSLFLMALLQVVVSRSGRRLTVGAVFLSIFLTWAAYPWYNNFQSVAYHLNYTFASLFVLTVIGFVIREDVTRPTPSWKMMLCALLAGGTNEALSVPMMCFAAVCWVLMKERRRYIGRLIVASFVGFLTLLTPAMFKRADGQIGYYPFNEWFGQHALKMTLELWPLWLSLALYGVIYMTRRERLTREDKIFFVGTVVASGVSIVMAITAQRLGRVMWMAQLMPALALVRLTDKFYFHKIKSGVKIGAAVVALALFAGWGYTLTVTQRQLAREQREVYELLKHTPSGPVYCDLTLKKDIPYWLKDVAISPFQRNYEDASAFGYLIVDATAGKRGNVAILPTALKDLPFDSWPKFDGDNDFRGAGEWLASRENCDHKNYWITMAAPGDNIAPYIKLMDLVKWGTITRPTRQRKILIVHDSIVTATDTIYLHLPSMPSRTDQSLTILSIDSCE
jgi:hypothetical protein